MPPSNPKSSMQLAGRSDSETPGDSKPGRGAKASKDAPQASSNFHFEPFEQRAYDMSYACVLIPRNPRHLLVGKVPDFIHKAIADTCSTFGWRLTLVQVQPEYFQWVVNAPVGVLPTKCIHTIREQTSKGILDKFKPYRENTQFQDFWAPGYLVLVSTQAHPPGLIEDFIVLTRQRQGLPRQGN